MFMNKTRRLSRVLYMVVGINGFSDRPDCRGITVQQLPLLIVERTKPVQRLTEIDREILTLPPWNRRSAATDTAFAISAMAAILANGSGLLIIGSRPVKVTAPPLDPGSTPTSRSTSASSRIGSVA
jgi:hypothetical protein